MDSGRLIINLSGDSQDVTVKLRAFASSDTEDFTVLDITGVLPDSLPGKIVYARKLDHNSEIEQSSLKDYVNCIGQLSHSKLSDGKHLRSFQLNGLPLIWITPLTQKHPFHHWGARMFFFKHLIRQEVLPFNSYNSITLIVQQSPALIRKILKGLELFEGRKVTILGNQSPPQTGSVQILKQFASVAKRYIKVQRHKIHSAPLKNLSAALVSINKGSFNKCPLMPAVTSFLQSRQEAAYINLADHLAGKSGDDRSSGLMRKAMPGLGFLIRICKDAIALQRRLRAYQMQSPVNPEEYLLSVALEEMEQVTGQIEWIYYHEWLKRIAGSPTGPFKFFYEDELYITGRIITHALKSAGNKQLVTYGYQHGNITANHTVYCIGNLELEASSAGLSDQLPFPDHFLLWGKHFQQQFNRFNNLDENKLPVTGNLQHILNNRKRIHLAKESGKLKLVWCTTSFELAKLEYDLLKDALLKHQNIILLLRMHPFINIKAELEALLDASLAGRVEWCENMPLQNLLPEIDLLVCSAHSSVFFDGINNQVPVIRMFTPFMMKEKINGGKLLFDASTSIEMEESIRQIFRGIEATDSSGLTDYLYNTDDSRWDKVVSNP